MAYNALNNLIDAYIYANGVQAITGQILNGVLKQMVSELGSGYHLMGVAGPGTVPEQNDYAMAYFAATAGEYTAFGGITLADGEVAVLLTYGNGSWSKQTLYIIPVGTADLVNDAEFITNTVADLVNYYTKTEIDTTLEDYPTLAALATALADFYTKAETDTKLADYYKKSETYDKDEVDSIVAALSRQEYIVAWDGLAAPDITEIPAGVTVTYSGNPYTGTLDASEDTLNKIYMVWNGVAYDMYATTQDGGFSWVPMGTTTVDLSQYATKAELAREIASTDEKFNDSRTKEELPVSWSVGYVIYSSGEISGNANYNNTEINVREGQFIQVATEASSAAAVVAAYDANDDYLIDASVAGTGSMHTYNYIVPAGVTKLRLSVYNRASDKHVYEYGPLYSALTEYTDERVDDLQAKLVPITKIAQVPVDAGAQTQVLKIPTIKANTSVLLGVSGDVVVNTFRVDGNELGQQRSDITALGQTVTYTPTVDVNALVLYLNGVTTAGTVSVTVDYGNNIAGIEDRVDYIAERQDNEEDCFGKALHLPVEVGFFIFDTGEVSGNTNYIHTPGYLPVKTGDKFVFLCDQGTTVGSVMAYDEEQNYLKDLSLAGSGAYRATSYTVPSGVKYLRFTFNNTDNLTKFVAQVYSAKKTVVDEIDTADYAEGLEMVSTTDYWLDENYHKTNWIMQANFREIGSGFSAIFVGKGWVYYTNGMTVKITPTHVQTLYNASGWYLSEEHGLTIGDYLDVRVESYADRTNESPEYTGDGDATFVRITLFDGVSEYTIEKAFFTGGGKPFVRIDGATAKADFYYWCTDLKRDLWCYGDSYFSIAQTRWPYWAITRGFKALWNGKPGANSQFMWANFARDLQHGNPRKVFWCLGMNDKDTGGAPNADWSKYIQRVKDICRLRGIELIMATIPIVPSTEADNTYKNQVVRNSGYKYVDFASAVMKPDGTGWYDGMMMDATHPSKTGARCLANAAMKLLIGYKMDR